MVIPISVLKSPMLVFKRCTRLFSTSSTNMAIHVSKNDSLMDEPVSIKISGLRKHQVVTLVASIREREDEVFMSNGYYQADTDGSIDIQRSPSVGGTYSGIDPMGFLASMVPAPYCKPLIRLTKRDVTLPQKVELSLLDGQQSMGNCSQPDQKPICSTTLNRWCMRKYIQRFEVNEGRVRGTLFVPSERCSYPGVIDLYGSSGRLKETRAALLANYGFTTLALPYFKYLDLPKELNKINFSYFQEAIAWFSKHPNVNSGGIGILGLSKGGELAQLMTVHNQNVKCLININGTPFLNFMDMNEGGDIFHKCVGMDGTRVIMTEKEEMILKDAYPYTEDDIIPIWKSDAKVLIITGEDDHQTCTNSFQVLYSLYPDNQRNKLTIKRYPGAGHLLEPPYTPVSSSSVVNFMGVIHIFNGGKYPDHAKAQEDAWTEIIGFLNNHLGGQKSLL